MLGRPTSFTQEIADEICERIVDGQTMRDITALDHMPSWSTIWRWLQANDAFRAQYARAREDGADAHADRALQEALTADDSEGSRVAGARLRWDALRWHASKCAPKRYGDKVQKEHSGPNGGPIQTTTLVVRGIEPKRD